MNPMTDTVHACGVDDCPMKPTWGPPPDVISVRSAGPCEVVTICPCRICDEHVSVDEVVVIGAGGQVHHLRCAIETLNDIQRCRDAIAALGEWAP